MPAAKGQRKDGAFRLTYATMFDPPERLHTRFEAALAKVKLSLGADHSLLIDGKDVRTEEMFEDRSPINRDWLLARFPQGDARVGHQALAAARKAFPAWSKRPWKDRVRVMRRAADQVDKRIYEIAAVMALEVGKNRMEALGDAAEVSDLIRYACDQMEAHRGFQVAMGKDPLKGYKSENTSVLRAYGVWAVISPFNFPAALTGGPSGAAILAGNSLVIKPASDTPWTARLIAECLRDGGLPDGVVNFVTGPGSTLGEALLTSPEVDGITFTGSYDVGMHIYRKFSQGKYPRPTILEMGGKNPSIVSRRADLDRAATGIVRSAFGLQGQKCSANSRIYIERPVYDEFVALLVERTQRLVLGDPTERQVYLGPVINEKAYKEFEQYTEELDEAGTFLTGGHRVASGPMSRGFFCEPTISAGVPLEHRLWKQEMFLPITMVHPVKDLPEAMHLANDSLFGLTAGFYGSAKETQWFFEEVAAGVTYANRPQGATTGAWPGFQPFGGWKGSGSSGKNAGGHYYLPLYMHEQVHTLVH